MGWSDSPLRTLTLPQDASDTDPRIVIGPDLPATLTRPGVTFYAAIIMWYDADTYEFEAIGDDSGTRIWVKGTYDPTHGLYYSMYELVPGPGRDPFLAFGGTGNPSSPKFLISFLDSDVAFAGTTKMYSSYGTDMGFGEVGCGYRAAGFVSTAGAEIVIPAASWTVEPESAFINNRIYRFDWRAQIGASAAGGMYGTVRVRYGSGAVAGTELARTYVDAPSSAWSPTREGYGYATFVGASTIENVSLTIQKNAGAAGNIILDSDANSPARIGITDMGDATDNAYLAAGNPTFG